MSKQEVLRVDIGLRLEALRLRVRFALAAPWTCLFGASGSGKTTILRAISGFVTPDSGSILLGDLEVLFDRAQGVWVAPHNRAIRSASQQAWLFPGTVRENVRYGVAANTSKVSVEEVLERFRLKPLSEARVEKLSGGERQRVSLARAVAASLLGKTPIRLLLLDEPFAGMDGKLRDELATQLGGWLKAQGMPVLSVTHDVGEAFLLGAEVIRIAGGCVEAQGPAEHVLGEERARLKSILFDSRSRR